MPGGFTPFILGVQRIDGEHEGLTPYGFYAKKLPDIIIPKKVDPGEIDLGDRSK